MLFPSSWQIDNLYVLEHQSFGEPRYLHLQGEAEPSQYKSPPYTTEHCELNFHRREILTSRIQVS